ncbi:transcriptional regulator [Ralstonia solanacearum]|nr:DJ-1/PfpI family protein [Ralstonia solanacearum]KFX28596.1 transcriptional regulator [Ralstonia solanacearum]
MDALIPSALARSGSRRTKRRALLAGACVIVAGLAAWFALQVHQDPGGVPAPQVEAGLPATRPEIPANPGHPGRARPLVAVVGHNANTEMTDFVVPYGVLKRADVADVVAVGTQAGPIQLFPAFRVEPDTTVAAFDAHFPDGADYVVVPAVHEDDDPHLLTWVRQQWAKGATVIGVCDGVWVLARAGLLAGRRATSHWYARDALVRQFPQTQWVSDRRYVVDDRVVTTTGVTASVPVTLALIETIGGTDRARAVADAVGAAGWSTAHASAGFRLSPRHLYTAAGNMLALWRHESLGVALHPGGDDVALALVADAHARTYLTSVLATADTPNGVRMASGLVFVPDRVGTAAQALAPLSGLAPSRPALAALDAALAEIGQRHGADTAALVALQLEYPMRRAARP